ncbi:DoxX family protein [Sphingobacterium endophyticum]|uniref:DoxX family protein n=1 Tax=Sphingobacterium endophyticum TaxID=2546448 RepID=UPI0012E1BD4A|nr:DoxX family protein [Sphingobacterium endophyticum]
MTRTLLWIGEILKILVCLFFAFDAIMKLIKSKSSIDTTMQLGLPQSCVQFLGAILLIATALYSFRKTSIYGLLLVVAYLGGAVAIMYTSKPESYSYLFPFIFGLLAVIAEYILNDNFRKILNLA